LRGALAAGILILIACASPALGSGDQPALEILALDASAPGGTPQAVSSGSLDARFRPLATGRISGRGGTRWLKIRLLGRLDAAGIPVLVLHTARQTHAEIFGPSGNSSSNASETLPRAATLAGFRGTQDTVFLLPGGSQPQSVYARIDIRGGDSDPVSFAVSTLDRVLEDGAEHARMIALSFGALVAVSLAALLIWFVLSDKLFILYATLFLLQALYVAYLSGQGFDWPLLSYARPLGSFAWNVPIGLSGAVGCLFVREIADLRLFSPRVYAIFGWFAAVFVLVTIANVAKLAGYGAFVNAVGNLVFVMAAIFSLVVAYVAWRRGNRAAGWFLIAWGLLEGFTMTAAIRFLMTSSADTDAALYYYGLPLSMVAASVLVALGVADRLREQRVALTEAERRAQTDALTGVLNRRSLIERLDAACIRARARGLPISLLFIDLDHFKQINDSHGHQAGDACLRAIIGPIHAELRQSDVIGRYGGEEFVVILSSADAAAAHPIAERILERVAGVCVEGFGEPIRLTCSIGVAASDTLGVWGEFLIAHADTAVYVAKSRGRNRVQMAAPLGTLAAG
jgi:diguanylate cyclase (GGDEF)-like protein